MSSVAESLFAGLCDDAAVFPPGNLPLEQAVSAHLRHVRSAHAELVGPLVLAVDHLARLAEAVADVPADAVELAVTAPLPRVGDALAAAGSVPAARLTALEVALPQGTQPHDVAPALDAALGDRDMTVFVEVPRDGHQADVLAELAGAGYLAKFRTGGERAELYPDEKELAASVVAAVQAGVPYKATAGLHHAVRNTDPVTGFEQHGFLNLLTATAVALGGADESQLAALLADRDGVHVAERVRTLGPEVRQAFRSFGTCSIAEPVAELAGLDLLDPYVLEDLS